MSLSKRQISIGFFSVVILFFLLGCVQTLSLITIPLTAFQLGTTAYQSIEKADIDAAVVSGVTEKELKKIKYLAIFMGKESTEQPLGRIGDLGAVVGDNLCIELAQLGFRVSDGSKLRKSTVKRLVNEGYSSNKVIRIGKRLGVHAIVTGNVTAAQSRSFGMLGVGRMNTVVQSATMKVIGVKRADTLMIITINYKVGQNPHVAAEGIAMVLKAKLEDPTVDIKEILKQEQKQEQIG